MSAYWEGLKEAIRLITQLDRQLIQVFVLSVYVSGTAAVVGGLLGIPFGAALALTKFPGRRFILGVLHTFMGLPPVVVGLVVFIALSRQGPLGRFGLLFTPAAMILAQTVLATPIIAGFAHAAIADIGPKFSLQALSLGANRFQLMLTMMREARLGLIAAMIAGLGRVIAEVGAVLMVGGNLYSYRVVDGTRYFKNITMVMTTFIVEQTRKGNWERSIALGLILIFFAYLINVALTKLQGSEAR